MNEGIVRSIYITDTAEKLPVALDVVHAVANRGLEGDRYFLKVGTFSKNEPIEPGRELTLIEHEALVYVNNEKGIQLTEAESRRNIVTENMALNDLVGKRFTIGDVLAEGIRLCHPCAHLEGLTRGGITEALLEKGGLRANILSDGDIRVGDKIVVEV